MLSETLFSYFEHPESLVSQQNALYNVPNNNFTRVKTPREYCIQAYNGGTRAVRGYLPLNINYYLRPLEMQIRRDIPVRHYEPNLYRVY